jgi:hypothetical protein
MDAQLKKKLTKIVKEETGIPTLKVRNGDEYDFHTISVWDLARMLEKAYNLGVEDEATSNAEDAAGAAI